jgi:hypothetical protein
VRYDDDPWWSALVTTLQAVGLVEDREPHGLVVTREDTRTVEIVMTREDWDELVSILHGTDARAVQSAAAGVRRLVLAQPAGHDYLVYTGTYELVPSETAELPPDPDLVRLQELAAQHPDGIIPGASWSAHPPGDDHPA